MKHTKIDSKYLKAGKILKTYLKMIYRKMLLIMNFKNNYKCFI